MTTQERRLRIVRSRAERLDELEPLFAALHEHQVTVAPELVDLKGRTAAEAWVRRRVKYANWLSPPESFLLIAELDERPIGYAVVSIAGGYDGWQSPNRIGEVEDIAVLPRERGRGVGTMLMDAVRDELLAMDVRYCRLRVIARNADAIRFYERRGMAVVSEIMLGRLDAGAQEE